MTICGDWISYWKTIESTKKVKREREKISEDKWKGKNPKSVGYSTKSTNREVHSNICLSEAQIIYPYV